jgi:hypothetical protein
MKKQTRDEFVTKSKDIFGDNIDYSKMIYINSRTKIILVCKKHGDFIVAPKDHLCYKRGCPICSGVRYNLETFLDAAKKVHGNRFLYDQVIFQNVKCKIIIGCKIHGDFCQTPDKHLSGQGCPKCKKSAHKDLVYIINEGSKIHANRYDYSKAIFKRMYDNIEIICEQHGSFWQTPHNHLSGQGCPQCARENTRLTINEFITKANLVHNNKFDYSNVNYVNCITEVEIICPQHGSFWQTAGGHLAGHNCPKCAYYISDKETAWLDSLGIIEEYRQKTIYYDGGHFKVDAFDPITNTVYEFDGDYWHGNPKIYNPEHTNKHNKTLFGTLYQKTLDKKQILVKLGYNIVSMWEKDFDEQRQKKGR